MSRTYDLEIAKAAKESVIKVLQQKNSSICDSYKALVKKIPDLIRNNGYLPTLIFCFSKNKDRKEFFYVMLNIIEWHNLSPRIISERFEKNGRYYDFEKYIDYIANIENTKEYMVLTKEMINLFIYIKKFVDGMIEGD